MKRMLEVYKHRHYYIDDVFKEYCKITSRFDKKSSRYYADIRDFEADWNERYDATKEKMNLILLEKTSLVNIMFTFMLIETQMFCI